MFDVIYIRFGRPLIKLQVNKQKICDPPKIGTHLAPFNIITKKFYRHSSNSWRNSVAVGRLSGSATQHF